MKMSEGKRGFTKAGFRLVIGAGLVFTGSFGVLADSCAPVPAGLVSWWPGESNATDIVSGNNGTFPNGIAFGSGEVGQAFTFDGVSTYVQVADAPALNPSSAMTLEGWVYPTAYSSMGVVSIATKEIQYAGTVQYQLAFLNSGGRWCFRPILTTQTGSAYFAGSTTVQLNTWYHLAMTYDGSTLKQYVNGTLDGSAAITGAIVTGSQPLTIGCERANWFFGGRVDELSLYNRALSASEIQAIYAAGGAGKCTTPTPPVVILQPTNQTVVVGNNATFDVGASGTAPLTYQWVFNGTNFLAGANAPTLQFTNIQVSQAGDYAVLITNAYGTTLSSNALLTVNLSPPCVTLAPGLVSWWPAEGNALDSVGPNNGTTVGGVTYAPGKVGQAFRFDGTGPHVEVSDSPSLRLTNELTIELWYNNNDLGSSGQFFGLVAKRAPYPGGCNFGINFGSPPINAVQAYLQDPNYAGYQVVSFSPVPNAGVFHHFAATYRQAALEQVEIKIYIDGQLEQTQTVSGNLGRTVSNTPLTIGSSNPTSEFFTGLIDEASIYSRALSDSEIQAVYNAGSAGKCTTPTPPMVFRQPTNQTVFAGSTATFEATASGTAPLSYQWLFNRTNLLPGANGSILQLTNVQVSQSGTYAVMVTNAYGSTLSSNATLTVNLPPPCASPPAGLVSWWPASGDAVDIVSGNNGTFPNGSAFAQGEVGQAFAFDGVSEYVQVADAPSLNPSTAMSLEGWVYVSAYPSMSVVAIVAKESQFGGAIQYQLGFLNSGGRWCFRPILTTQNSSAYFAGSTTVVPNTWYHLAMTYDGSILKQYVNGVLDGSMAITGPILTGTQPLTIGCERANWFFNGRVDEMSLYDRALSQSEMQSIYNAGASGKCVVPVQPSVGLQPRSQTVTIGSNVVFTVGVGGTPPFMYQWQYNGGDITDATNASLTLTNVQFAQAGNYSVNVSNAVGSVTSTNALLNVVFPPATMQVTSVTNAVSGGSVSVPVVLLANGNENAVGFSLNFPPSLLTFADVSLGGGASGASLLFNTNLVGSGKLGVGLAFPAGQTAAAGAQEVVDITFTVAVVTNTTSALISFGDQPIARELADASGAPLSANYVNGTVSIPPATLEGDVWPRPNGDDALTISDWVQEGRYVAGLDSPTNGLEFQRADCAPRSSLGDGQITIIDWVQVGRYVAGLDPVTAAGGPTNQTSGPSPMVMQPGAPHKLGGGSRELLVTSSVLFAGQSTAASVQLVAQGNENALGFSLDYDPTLVSLAGISAGANAAGATLDINTNQAASGRIGVALALPTGTSFAAGTQELVKLSFLSLVTNTATDPVSFGDSPVVRQVSDPTATALAASYVGGALSINPVPSLSISQAGQNVNLSWPGWATNYVLQSSDSLGFLAAWSNAPVTVTVTNGTGVAKVPVSGQAQFYRLFHQ